MKKTKSLNFGIKSALHCVKKLTALPVVIGAGCLTIFGLNYSTANNVAVVNVANPSGTTITFDITWDNSWRVSTGPSNYDGAWVFVKYQVVPVAATNCQSDLVWTHADITTAGSSVTVGALLTMTTVSDAKGVFLHRSANGTGNITTHQITLVLNIPAGTYNYDVFAIEMVNIPTANFELGDGISTYTFNSITIDASTAALTTGVIGGGIVATIPATYPNGYTTFWTMKYEMSQKQYVDFLNTLTYDQQATRTIVAPNTAPTTSGVCAMHTTCDNRSGIKLIQAGTGSSIPAVYGNDLITAPADAFNSAFDGQTIAMNYLSWDDLMSFLDWAALRPMTNFEYEKITRGTLSRLGDEYVWGTINVTQALSTSLTNGGQTSEVSTATGNGLVAYNAASTSSPLRTGFAATGATSRETAGAAHFGVMDMAGNVWEMVLGGINPSSGGYLVTYSDLGDGALDASGNFNTANWPLTYTWYGSRYVWHFEVRGGDFSSTSTELRISDRSQANINSQRCYGCDHDAAVGGSCVNVTNADVLRKRTQGGRGVR
ncbi:MAG: hypothetical protein COA57_10595 [Flavobacteriales bacterium]|nr:MAG: hypothetical protein COA57_10595 [Flavobacteriales bacterium]